MPEVQKYIYPLAFCNYMNENFETESTGEWTSTIEFGLFSAMQRRQESLVVIVFQS